MEHLGHDGGAQQVSVYGNALQGYGNNHRCRKGDDFQKKRKKSVDDDQICCDRDDDAFVCDGEVKSWAVVEGIWERVDDLR